MLEEVAEFYETQVDQTMANLSSIIEPVLIIFLGAAVGGIALAIITPIYSLTTKLGS
jgi:type IV pilus assembly protein PilC